ncbi:hypothetical protein Ciccas_004611 [Cichlidogyrus casuarinus]|uniref:Uncharacterized protein n=1 Tax=Cichlidogyrus casuarinus TaxID=1844966 RepID=A0ABD2QBY5_9PLAT
MLMQQSSSSNYDEAWDMRFARLGLRCAELGRAPPDGTSRQTTPPSSPGTPDSVPQCKRAPLAQIESEEDEPPCIPEPPAVPPRLRQRLSSFQLSMYLFLFQNKSKNNNSKLYADVVFQRQNSNASFTSSTDNDMSQSLIMPSSNGRHQHKKAARPLWLLRRQDSSSADEQQAFVSRSESQ